MPDNALIKEIEKIERVPDSDNLSFVTIGGWEIVFNHNLSSYKVGDKVILIVPDSIVKPGTLLYPAISDYSPTGRVVTIRLRKQYSQGVIIGQEFIDLVKPDFKIKDQELDTEVSAIFGVEHYTRPEKNDDNDTTFFVNDGDFPTELLSKTDEENLNSHKRWFEELIRGEYPFTVTLKMDGSSTTIGRFNGGFKVCSRNYSVREFPYTDIIQVYRMGIHKRMKYSDNYNLVEGFGLIRDISPDNLGPMSHFWVGMYNEKLKDKLEGTNIIVQGEICGPGIQNNHLNLKDFEIFVFNAFENRGDGKRARKLSNDELLNFCKERDIKLVPEVKLPFKFKTGDVNELNELQKFVNTLKYPSGKLAEGIVIKIDNPDIKLTSRKLNSVKIISQTFSHKNKL